MKKQAMEHCNSKLSKMGENYVIGVDGGTEGLRAGVFDSKGTPLAIAAASYPTSFPQPSWAEQNPTDWWQVNKYNAH